MFQYRETMRKTILTIAGISTFYLSGCISVPENANDTSNNSQRNQQSYSTPALTRLQSQEERYHSEKKENAERDLLKYINPDFKRSVESTRDGVDGIVSAILPGDPKIKKSKLVWTKDW